MVKKKRKATAPKRRTQRLRRNTDFLPNRFKTIYSTTNLVLLFIAGIAVGLLAMYLLKPTSTIIVESAKKEYWMILLRSKNTEYLYYGVPGNRGKSDLMKTFRVKTGVSGESPTPLPNLLGKNYWKIVKKYPSGENVETAPYFLELDIPVEDGYFGPVPYNECNGQCIWALPGYFGLHGVNGDTSKLSNDNPGSSGCIRHSDSDITYLYNLLNVDEGVRYYIEN